MLQIQSYTPYCENDHMYLLFKVSEGEQGFALRFTGET